MGGVVGIYGTSEAAKLVVLALHALRHRASGEFKEIGAVVWDEREEENLHSIRGFGSVEQVFWNADIMHALHGRSIVGCIRENHAGYGGDKDRIQPCAHRLPCGIGHLAVAYSGNFTNMGEMRKELLGHTILSTTSPMECLLNLITRCNGRAVESRISEVLQLLDGSYALIALSEDSLIGVRDPNGSRPLVVGRKEGVYILASESCALYAVGARLVGDVDPGEMVVINEQGLQKHKVCTIANRAPASVCSIEHLYMARTGSVVDGSSVYEVRTRLGRLLATEGPVPDADIVVAVSYSAIPVGKAYAREQGIEYGAGILRGRSVGPVITAVAEEVLGSSMSLQYNVVADVVRDQRVVLVDTGFLSPDDMKELVLTLKQAGAARVHVRIARPSSMTACRFSPERTPRNAMSASYQAASLQSEADSLAFLSPKGLRKALSVETATIAPCLLCFEQDC